MFYMYSFLLLKHVMWMERLASGRCWWWFIMSNHRSSSDQLLSTRNLLKASVMISSVRLMKYSLNCCLFSSFTQTKWGRKTVLESLLKSHRAEVVTHRPLPVIIKWRPAQTLHHPAHGQTRAHAHGLILLSHVLNTLYECEHQCCYNRTNIFLFFTNESTVDMLSSNHLLLEEFDEKYLSSWWDLISFDLTNHRYRKHNMTQCYHLSFIGS